MRKRLIDLVVVLGIIVIETFGVGFVVVAIVLGDIGDVIWFFIVDRFVVYIGIVLIEVLFGLYKIYRLFCCGNCQFNYAIYIVVVI